MRADILPFLSKNPEERYDQIQRLSFYLGANKERLKDRSPQELLAMSDEALIEGSHIESESLAKEARIRAYEAFATQDFLATNGIPTTGGIKCKKCDVLMQAQSQQTRGMDEGSTTFFECKKCHARFKV